MLFARGRLAALIAWFVLAAACGNGSASSPPTSPSTPSADPEPADSAVLRDDMPEPVIATIWPVDPTGLDGRNPPRWTIEVVRRVPHDPGAFTQGLELINDSLYESTGRYGQSTLRRVDLSTGDVLASADLAPELFGEGITRVGDTVIQLTWKEQTALRWQLPDLVPLEPFTYTGEGWGACLLDDDTIVTTDGSRRLVHRDPVDFSVTSSVAVEYSGDEVAGLNELECVDGFVLANIFGSDTIVVVDPGSGVVIAIVDASPVSAVVDRPDDSSAVLNGIADLGDGTLLLGGKLWPEHVVVKLVVN